MKNKTYEEWAELGYHVRSGQQAMFRSVKGKPLFTKKQTDINDNEDRGYNGESFGMCSYDESLD